MYSYEKQLERGVSWFTNVHWNSKNARHINENKPSRMHWPVVSIQLESNFMTQNSSSLAF